MECREVNKKIVTLEVTLSNHTAHGRGITSTLVFQCLMQNIVVDFPVLWREVFPYGKSKSFIFYVAIVLSVTKVFSQEVF
jgi:hypothetical protein